MSVGGLMVNKRHWLRVLLLIEFGALGLFVGRVVGFVMNDVYELRLIVMRISACEARIGLAILVSLVRLKGNDYTELSLVMKL